MFCAKCGTQIPEDAAFCTKCGNQVVHQFPAEPQVKPELPVAAPANQVLSMQKYTPAEIKEYLGHAKRLETNLYTLQTARNRLLNLIGSLGKSRTFEPPESSAGEGFLGFWSIFFKCFLVGMLICVFVCGNAKDSILANLLSVVTVVLIFFNPELLLGAAISLGGALAVAMIICLFRVAGKRSEYRAAYRHYLNEIEGDKNRVAFEKEQIKALYAQKYAIDKDITKTRDILDKLYAFDVVKPKYREFVPIVTMYEYFDNERCYELAGPLGAYNLYEDELHHQIIINSLNKIMSMLSQIAQNQRMLYDAIQESNDYAQRICDQASRMIKSAKATERNTAIAAYNSKIAAENSTICAYMDICRM